MIGYTARNFFVLIFFALVFGMIAGFSALLFSSWSLYRLLFVIFVLVLLPVFIVASGSLLRALLVALVLAIPLSFSLAPFGKEIIYHGKTQPVIVLYLYDFPLIGVIVLWILEVLFIRRKITPKSGIILAAAFWIIWSVVSTYNSENLSLSWLEILRMFKLSILMMAISTLVRDKRDIRAIFIALFLSLILQSFIAVVQYTTGSFFNLLNLNASVSTKEIVRVSGTMDWPNTLGAFLAALTSMAFILFSTNADKKLNILSLVAGLAGSIALIVTYSRGSWVSFFIAFAIGILVALTRKWLNSVDIFRLVAVSLLIAAVASLFAQGILLRLDQIESSPGVIIDRIALNKIAENMILAHPLLGVGINTFVEVMKIYDTTGISYSLAYPVHNVYLFIASETGLVGLVLFLVFTMAIFSSFLRAVKSYDRLISVSAICLVSGMTVFLISNLADVHLKTEPIFVLFWFFAGLGIAILTMKNSLEVPQTIAGNSR